jgi:hypothetical protein
MTRPSGVLQAFGIADPTSMFRFSRPDDDMDGALPHCAAVDFEGGNQWVCLMGKSRS